eukprot:TRINITY_DN12536_c0_g1_i1.p1 TRINITY_DN12536_c0_g1~~TRINITY_DN12536_c0_g1_i1.p1  ORF type:complete len:640 (-),score=175.14 TRINITY_DN12536_c0_g1_i1:10-1782(-)
MDFRFPIFTTLTHMAACAVVSYIVLNTPLAPMFNTKAQTPTRKQILSIVALSFFFCVSVVFGNMSFLYVSLAFNQIIGAATPIFTTLVSAAFGKYENTLTYASLLPIFFGVAMSVKGEIDFDLIGFLYCFSAVIFRAIKSVTQGLLLTKHEPDSLDSMNLLFLMSSFSIVLLLPLVILFEPNFVQVRDPVAIFSVLGSAFVAVFVNLTNFMVTRHTSALTLQVAGSVKLMLAIFLSNVVFATVMSWLAILGCFVTVCGVTAYMYSTQLPASALPVSSSGSTHTKSPQVQRIYYLLGVSLFVTVAGFLDAEQLSMMTTAGMRQFDIANHDRSIGVLVLAPSHTQLTHWRNLAEIKSTLSNLGKTFSPKNLTVVTDPKSEDLFSELHSYRRAVVPEAQTPEEWFSRALLEFSHEFTIVIGGPVCACQISQKELRAIFDSVHPSSDFGVLTGHGVEVENRFVDSTVVWVRKSDRVALRLRKTLSGKNRIGFACQRKEEQLQATPASAVAWQCFVEGMAIRRDQVMSVPMDPVLAYQIENPAIVSGAIVLIRNPFSGTPLHTPVQCEQTCTWANESKNRRIVGPTAVHLVVDPQ